MHGLVFWFLEYTPIQQDKIYHKVKVKVSYMIIESFVALSYARSDVDGAIACKKVGNVMLPALYRINTIHFTAYSVISCMHVECGYKLQRPQHMVYTVYHHWLVKRQACILACIYRFAS